MGDDEAVRELVADVATANDVFANTAEVNEEKVGTESYLSIFRKVYLESINTFWMEHLDTMDMLRSSVSLRAYGQKDPLIEYKREGLIFFRQMLTDINANAGETMSRLDTGAVLKNLEQRATERAQQADQLIEQSVKSGLGTEKTRGGTVVKKDEEKVGRNDPCTCGSGKKYKACHGK